MTVIEVFSTISEDISAIILGSEKKNNYMLAHSG